MSKGGKVDVSELKAFRDKLERSLQGEQYQLFLESCTKELAARLLAKVIKRTPTGIYEDRVGGTLKRGWTAGVDQDAVSFVNQMSVTHTGNEFHIEIINPVEYASYVEYGHRTRNHKGWVEGQFFLTIPEEEIRQAAPAILERKLQKYLDRILKGGD